MFLRFLLTVTVAAALAGVSNLRTYAAISQPNKKTDPYREFVASCTQAFATSASNENREGGNEVGQKICECTAKESKHEKVSIAALKRETELIKKDPKYKIQNQGLLNSLQYCSIEIMKGGL